MKLSQLVRSIFKRRNYERCSQDDVRLHRPSIPSFLPDIDQGYSDSSEIEIGLEENELLLKYHQEHQLRRRAICVNLKTDEVKQLRNFVVMENLKQYNLL